MTRSMTSHAKGWREKKRHNGCDTQTEMAGRERDGMAPPDEDRDPEATSSGPPPLPVADDTPAPVAVPESRPTQPAAI